MPVNVDWKIGVEIELLAPPGATRLDLARACAERSGGSVRTVLHQDSEPSKVPGNPLFYNLTQGFEALDRNGRLIARCVDDLTLQDDLNRQTAPRAGWWRIVSDDDRLLRMLAIHTDPSLPLPNALRKLPDLFAGELIAAAGGMYRLVDSVGAPLAIAAPLPGERERPCELITPPLESDHLETLDSLLGVARNLRFSLPREGATHIHFDATSLQNANTIANVVNLFDSWGSSLRQLCATPKHFRRAGAAPATLGECVNQPDFRDLSWPLAQRRLADLGLSKYCDFNLKNLVHPQPDKETFEVRILPSYLEAEPLLMAAELFAALLRRCQDATEIASAPAAVRPLADVVALLNGLIVSAQTHNHWLQRAGDSFNS